MPANGVFGTGISAHKRAHDLSDFSEELDMIEELGVQSIELPTFDMDIVVGAKIRAEQLTRFKTACAGRDVGFTVHGPLAINFMDEPYRLQRHMDVLKASLEVAAEVKATNYVLHSGMIPTQQAAGIEAAYERQREWLSRGGDIAKQHGLTLCVETLFADNGTIQTASPVRLARELELINHSAVMATIDFSHAYIKLDFDGRRADYVNEIAALAPFAKHLHMHDSFGRQDDIWMFTEGERLAYGHGDLHLPVGWGDIPWGDLMATCVFPQGVVFNIELQQRYWYEAQACVDTVKAMAHSARTSKMAQAAE
jgi:sugar phosphate isomerase/epimerase